MRYDYLLSVGIMRLNATVEKTDYIMSGLVPGETNKVVNTVIKAARNDTELADELENIGVPVKLYYFAGGISGEFLTNGFKKPGVSVCPIKTVYDTNINTVIINPDGVETRLEGVGTRVTHDEFNELTKLLYSTTLLPDYLFISGSLPPGISDDAYAGIIGTVNDSGCRTVLDCEGEPFNRALRANPYLAMTDKTAMRSYMGITPTTPGEAESAIKRMHRETGVAMIYIGDTLGCIYCGEKGLISAVYEGDGVPIVNKNRFKAAFVWAYEFSCGSIPDAMQLSVAMSLAKVSKGNNSKEYRAALKQVLPYVKVKVY